MLMVFSVPGVNTVMLVTLSLGSHVSHAYVQMWMEVEVSLPFPATRIRTLEPQTVNVCLDIQVIVHVFIHSISETIKESSSNLFDVMHSEGTKDTTLFKKKSLIL